MTKLAPVQLEAIVRADGRRGFGFFLDMGLGKTLTALTEFNIMRRFGAVSRLVVICPNSFKGGWKTEIAKHGFPFSVFLYESNRSHAGLEDQDVLVINYEATRTDKGRAAIVRFTHGHESYLVLDESIKLKGRTSKQTQAIVGKDHKRYPKPGLVTLFKFVRLLSGKPMTQGPHDLWAQLKAIDATNGVSYFGWMARYCQLGGWENRQVVGILNEDLLQKHLEPVSFTATKKHWLKGLPEKLYTTRRYQLGPVLQKHYDEMEEDFLTYINGERFTVDVAIAKYEKISQIQCGFLINDDAVITEIVPPDRNPRMGLLQEILDEEVTGKAIIVYRHRHVGALLVKYLTGYHEDGFAWIRGGMGSEAIDAEKEHFNNGRAKLMLMQAEAGKYGHTLLGTPDDPCSTMIFFENSYSLDTRSQLEDRIHRRGAVSESCLYVDLSGSDYDAGVTAALQRKERMFLKAFPEAA